MEKQKFIRMFDRSEIHLTACAVTKDPDFNNIVSNGLIFEPNQFWQRDPRHERALMKVYECNRDMILYDNKQFLKISMFFLGRDSSNGWGELQFLIKAPALVKLARHRCFDTRVNRWVEETKPIQPRTDLGTHSYLALRFYHQDYLPPRAPKTRRWYFEPVYVSIKNSDFYRIDVSWEKEEITVTTTTLMRDSSEIPKHLK